MEYPELKRAVREQYERLRPSVVLIEDKASGTQLIQELIAEGLMVLANDLLHPVGGKANTSPPSARARPRAR